MWRKGLVKVPATAAVTDTPLKSYPDTLEGCVLWLDNGKGIALLLEDQIHLSTEYRRQQRGHAGRTSSCPPAMTYKKRGTLQLEMLAN